MVLSGYAKLQCAWERGLSVMRKRFTPAERKQFTPGTSVEWRNGGHWHPGTISGPIETNNGWHSIPLTNHADTRTVVSGQRISGSPAFIRLPAPPAAEAATVTQPAPESLV